MCPVFCTAQWLDMKNWNPSESTSAASAAIATKINRLLKNPATECGMGPDRVRSHSVRVGRAATLYDNGIGPIDIQRWGRWEPAVYMRYVWRENARLHILSYAITRRADLSDHIIAPGKIRGKCPPNRHIDVEEGRKARSRSVGETIETPFGEVMSNFGHEMKK